jgi:hypothetical protein
MLGITTILLQRIIADPATEENHQMKMDVVIRVRKYGMHIKLVVGLSPITTLSNNVLENSPLRFDATDDSYKENLLSQSHEGCNLDGFFQVNKVSGNFHVAPGRSFAMNGMHVHDTVSH